MKAPLLEIAFRNVWLNWRQSTAALLSIAAGFTALCLFEGYIADVQSMYRDFFHRRLMFGQLLVDREGRKNPDLTRPENLSLITPEEQDFVQGWFADRGMTNRVRFLIMSGFIGNGETSAVFQSTGFDVAEAARMRGPRWAWNTLAGKPLEQGNAESVLLGRTLGRLLGCAPDRDDHRVNGVLGYEPVDRPFRCTRASLQLSGNTVEGQANAIDVVPLGLVDAGFQELDQKYVMLPLTSAQELFDTRSVSFISLEFNDGVDPASLEAAFAEAAKAKGFKLYATPWQLHRSGDIYGRTMEYLAIFKIFVVTVIIVIAAMSVLNTLVKIVRERTREIGTLRSLGFLPAQVARIFMAEGALLGLVGSGIGLIATMASGALINAVGILYKAGFLSEPVPFRIAVQAASLGKSAMLMCLLSTAVAVIAARHAARLKITDALSST